MLRGRRKREGETSREAPPQSRVELCCVCCVVLLCCCVCCVVLLSSFVCVFVRFLIVWRVSWVDFGSFWGVLGGSWAPLGASWRGLGGSWRHLGRSWGRLGRSWVGLANSRSFLSQQVAALRLVWAPFGGQDGAKMAPKTDQNRCQKRSRKKMFLKIVLEPSWVDFGSSWVPSWGPGNAPNTTPADVS